MALHVPSPKLSIQTLPLTQNGIVLRVPQLLVKCHLPETLSIMQMMKETYLLVQNNEQSKFYM